ncbi:MAG: hypothetical protein HY066_07580 [Betaproteobacteria bacterium]|nr:hypothetical protein [Betaproteobacteria bacterium]
MNKSPITLRIILVSVVAGFGGALAGQALSRILFAKFADSPVWELPAIFVGVLAVMILAFMLVPQFLFSRRLNRDGNIAPSKLPTGSAHEATQADDFKH